MALWIALLVVCIFLGLILTIWIMWRAAKATSTRTSPSPSTRTRTSSFSFGKSLRSLFGGGSAIDPSVWDELKDVLVLSDIGVQLSDQLVEGVRSKTNSETSPESAIEMLSHELVEVFHGGDNSTNKLGNQLVAEGSPAIWLVVGVNGSGKTTSIAKLAHQEIQAGKKVVLAAADTFRAAAIDQLEKWAERIGAGFVGGEQNADASSVVFDAIEHGKARGADLVLIDTAGRLHTKVNLMEELAKIKRTAEKAGGKVSETLLVIDATTGQNGLAQASQFTSAVDVTGIILSKLDGTAKGGIVAAIAHKLGIPIKRVGTGEGVDDLQPFSAEDFVDSLIVDV